ncbi:MAG: hypothetical protein IJO32_07600 [Bacilli bacterium]|nr:hypothetical protein [Bacilli bacterium]
MEKIDNRNKVTLIIIWILILLISLIGGTFTYFSAIKKSDKQIITTRNLSISVIIENSTNLKNIEPTDWDSSDMSKNENNKNIAVIPFRVTSKSRLTGTYSVDLNTNITENNLYDGGKAEDIMYKIYKDGKEVISGNFNEGEFNKKVVSGIISRDRDLNDEYKLYVYIDETNVVQDKLQGISFGLTLVGRADQTE